MELYLTIPVAVGSTLAKPFPYAALQISIPYPHSALVWSERMPFPLQYLPRVELCLQALQDTQCCQAV